MGSSANRGPFRVFPALLATLAVMLLAALTGLPASAGQAAPARPAGAPPTGTANVAALDVVMLVDESGSETPAKVADEKQTAGTIVQTMLNPRSRVTVIGFGGVNNVVAGQSPVDVTCQPTIASGAQNLSYLASCVGQLHRRSEQQGDDTDYAAALQQAMGYFAPGSAITPPSPSGALKVVLMMTDGAVDVARDPAYTHNGLSWQEGEQQAINEQLATARTDGAQIWPLGFGTDTGPLPEPQALSYLNNMAQGGASTTCDSRTVSKPHAVWVNSPSDAINALDELYAEAGCLGSSTDHGQATGTQPVDLHVTIPAIASDAAISVDRTNPGIQVLFYPPGSTTPWSDASAISGSANSPVEVLHLNSITQADAGTWTIKLTGQPGMASQQVSATVFWQGAVRAIITPVPLTAKPGQRISVTLAVLGPNGPITDPATLKSLVVGITASGDGLPSPEQVPVTGAGGATGAGGYAGTFTAPNQEGALTFTGTAAGYGLYATQFPGTVTVSTATAGFTATPAFNVATTVQDGGSLAGQVIFTNQTGAARQVKLVLDSATGTASISPSGAFPVPAGNPPSVPFTVTVDRNAPTGPAWFRVSVVDATTGQVYNEVTQNVTVKKPPGFLAQWLLPIIGLLVLLALIIAGLLALRARRRWRKNVADLTAILRRDGHELGAPLRAPQKWSDTFTFIIHDEGGPDPRLDWPQPGVPVYLVRRTSHGMVRLLTPNNNDSYDIVVGSAGERLEHNGLELAFRDRRTRRGSSGPTGKRSGATPPSMAPPAMAAPAGMSMGDPLDDSYPGQGYYPPPNGQNPTRLDNAIPFDEQQTGEVHYPPPQYPPASEDDWLQ
jgi:hypothetical protein